MLWRGAFDDVACAWSLGETTSGVRVWGWDALDRRVGFRGIVSCGDDDFIDTTILALWSWDAGAVRLYHSW
jgi:hypothetical protein